MNIFILQLSVGGGFRYHIGFSSYFNEVKLKNVQYLVIWLLKTNNKLRNTNLFYANPIFYKIDFVFYDVTQNGWL